MPLIELQMGVFERDNHQEDLRKVHQDNEYKLGKKALKASIEVSIIV